ncbi:MAG: Ada metal-binding domain-containing protein [bacterium]|nr:Ada metal-binding domain-containing protein [bacterium]
MLNLDFQKIKKFLIEKEDKIILLIGFILVAFLSFGAGKLSETYRPNTPIIFKNAPDCSTSLAKSETAANATDIAKTEGKIIGNKNSKIYHTPGSASYNKISPENRVYFNTEADAQKAGYRKTKM